MRQLGSGPVDGSPQVIPNHESQEIEISAFPSSRRNVNEFENLGQLSGQNCQREVVDGFEMVISRIGSHRLVCE